MLASSTKTDIKTWTGDNNWVYSISDPFLGNISETVLMITGGVNWIPGAYKIENRVQGWSTSDGPQNMLRLTVTPASPVPATGGIGYIVPSNEIGYKNLVFDGNSQTSGTGASVGASYPDQLINLFYAASDPSYVKTDVSVGGQTIEQMATDASTEIDPLFNITSANTIFVWEMTNSMYVALNSATVAYDDFKAYCQDRKMLVGT